MQLPKYIEKQYDSFKAVTLERKRLISEFIAIGDLDRAYKMSKCATGLVYGWNSRKQKGGFVSGNFCDDRFCPSCQQQLHKERASKLSFMTQRILPADTQFRFWTFSPFANCDLSVLRDNSRACINVFNAVVKKFFSKENGVIGYWRILEFTEHSKSVSDDKSFVDLIDNYSEFHPHIHVLFAYKAGSDPFVNVFEVSEFIKEYTEKMKRSKDARYQYFKSVGDVGGIVNYKVPDTSTAGFSFELCKYISLSKNLSSSNLKGFVEQVSSLQCFRHTGVLLWSKVYQEAYIEFIQNANSEEFCKFDKDNLYFLFSYKNGKFFISEWKPKFIDLPSPSLGTVVFKRSRGSPVRYKQSKFIS